ncbi:MAG: hypothetical protein QOC70_2584 [Verrucomicrobiota bacterium]|jgi:type II secretory pathway pseudopilin PulG
MISVFILMLLLMMAVPSLNGVLADQRLHRSLDRFNRFVHQAQQHAVAERRAYLVVWGSKSIEMRPEVIPKGEDPKPTAEMPVTDRESFQLNLPSALSKEPPSEWVFWPTGTCEPAIVKFVGREGTWTANYSPLTAQAELTEYVVR